jgi:hypothetical protein
MHQLVDAALGVADNTMLSATNDTIGRAYPFRTGRLVGTRTMTLELINAQGLPTPSKYTDVVGTTAARLAFVAARNPRMIRVTRRPK